MPTKNDDLLPSVPTRNEIITALERRTQELREKARPKKDLVAVVEGIVETAFGKIVSTHITPNPKYGGQSRSYSTGHSLSYELKIFSEKTQIVKTLNFHGWPFIQSGDFIRASILRAETVKKEEGYQGLCKNNFQIYYFDRLFKETETAFKLEKLDPSGKVLITYLDEDIKLD